MDMKYYAVLLGCASVALLGMVGNNQIADKQVATALQSASVASVGEASVFNFKKSTSTAEVASTQPECKPCSVAGISGAQKKPYDYCALGAFCQGDSIAIQKISQLLSFDKTNSQNDVIALQSFLERKGFLEQKYITGTFGPQTKKAVMLFQKKYGIEVTGSIGIQTRAKINNLIGEEEGEN
jgi:murein L,D-transpeptidase YcbB/YkuD